jgi:hypothetical protein
LYRFCQEVLKKFDVKSWISEGSFTLVFDETPEFDGEPAPAPVKEHEGVWEYRKAR